MKTMCTVVGRGYDVKPNLSYASWRGRQFKSDAMFIVGRVGGGGGRGACGPLAGKVL